MEENYRTQRFSVCFNCTNKQASALHFGQHLKILRFDCFKGVTEPRFPFCPQSSWRRSSPGLIQKVWLWLHTVSLCRLPPTADVKAHLMAEFLLQPHADANVAGIFTLSVLQAWRMRAGLILGPYWTPSSGKPCPWGSSSATERWQVCHDILIYISLILSSIWHQPLTSVTVA